MGVAPHPEEEYNKEVEPKLVTSQQDGIVVIEPLPEKEVKPEPKKDPTPVEKAAEEVSHAPKKITKRKRKPQVKEENEAKPRLSATPDKTNDNS
jgi:hypothetical protein